MMKESSKPQEFLIKNNPWANNENTTWLASTVCLSRNVEKHKFPGKLSIDRRKQIVSLVSKEMTNTEEIPHPVLAKAEDLSGLEKEFLIEHFLISQGFHEAASGEAFILNEEGNFITTINLRNHIIFQFLDIQNNLEDIWNKIVKIETLLGKAINYSYSPKYGFLTADPAQCGTGLQITMFLQPSALLHTERNDEVMEKLADESLIITGMQGSPKELIGDVLVVQNAYTLGLTEENILTNLRSFATKYLIEERSARNELRKEESAAIKDKVSRAYGILIHSYQIDAVEALNALSLLKLGIDLGWVGGSSIAKINELFFNCRRAHLLIQFQQKLSQEELLHKRAEYIHGMLKGVHLTI
jgi:protein arginine kinase